MHPAGTRRPIRFSFAFDHRHAQFLREIMQVYDSSLLSEGSSDPSEASTGFRRILDIMANPAVITCAAAAEEKGRLRLK